MNVSEIIAAAQAQVEESYDTPKWVTFINAALDDLTPIANILNTVTLPDRTIASGGAIIPIAGTGLANACEILTTYITVTLPAALPREQLRLLPMNDILSRGWKLTHDNLILQGLGAATRATVDVDIYRRPNSVANLIDVPEISAQYHGLIVSYVCAKSQQKEEELSDKNDFYAEYLIGKNAMAMDRIWATEPQNRKFIHKARLAAKINMPIGRRR